MTQDPLRSEDPQAPAVPPESVAEQAPGPAPAPRRRRWWFWPLAVLVQVLLLAVVLLIWVLGTESGLRSALALADDLAPGLVRVEGVEGRIAGDLHLKGVQVRLPTLHLDAESLELRWRPLSALTGTLKVQELTGRGIAVLTAPSPPSDEPLTLPSLALPIGVDVEQALVEGLSIGQLPGETGPEPPPPFVIDRIRLAAALTGSRLDLRELALELPEPSLSARALGEAELTGNYPLGLDLNWTLTLPRPPAPAESANEAPAPDGSGPNPGAGPADATPAGATLAGTGRVSGDLAKLHLEHSITGALDLGLTADATDLLHRPAWDARLALRRVDLPAFDPGLPQVDLHGDLTSSGDLDQAGVRGKLEGTVQGQPEFGHLLADLDLTWAGQTLTIRTLKVREDASGGALDATGKLVLAQDPGSFDLQASWTSLRWPLTGAALAEVKTGGLNASGTFDAYRYSLTAQALGRDLPPVALDLKGQGTRTGTRLEALRLDGLDGRVEASGDLAWDPAPTWRLKVKGDGLDPGLLVPDLPARISFEADSAGTLDGYDLHLTGETAGPALPTSKLALVATGDSKSAKVETLHIDTLDGRIDAQGQAAWVDPGGNAEPTWGPTWEATLSVADLNPGKQWPEWPGKLAGRVSTSGRLTATGPDLGAELADIQGQLRGYPVAASGKLRVAGQTVTIDEVLAASGPSKARVSGSLGERLALSFAVDSPDLKTLLPEAQGSIKADGTLAGTAAAPEVKVKLAAKGVQVAGQGIESLDGDVDVGLGPQGRLDLRLKGRKLAAGGLTWQDLDLLGEGSMTDHRLSVNLKGEPLSVRLKASGGRKPDNAYQGSLAELELASKDYGQWRLQRPAPIALALPKASVGPLCLRDGKGGSGGCLGFEQTAAGKWGADIDLDRLAFARLGPLVPKDLNLEGAAALKGRFSADGPVLTGTAALTIPKGSVSLRVGRQSQTLDFSGARLGLDSGAKALTAKLDLPLAGIGGANADLSLAGWRLDAPARPDQPLAGRVRAQVSDLKRIGKLVPDVTGLTGALDLDLGLSGNLGRPGIKGGGRLTGVAFDVPLLGLAVRNMGLTADSVAANHIVYNGGLDLGGGRLTLTGDSAQGPAGWLTQVRIAGDRLKVANTKEYFALASPDITLKVGPGGLELGGEVRVPEARIRPRAIPPGTVSPSGDVVIGTRTADGNPAAKQAEPFPIAADLRLVLGDAVSIDAFGLRGLLRGDLRVLKAPGREPVGDGQISVVDGTYRLSGAVGVIASIGKPLTVEQGILVFAKTPLTNPGLVLTAQREGGDVTAGVRVLGTVKKPKLAFFSESDPDMSTSEITSYLITGVPPKRDSSDDDRSLALGTYITPKLYMEYESNLGDAADKVKLRYELTNRIELQTETGDGQGADIFYKFEN